MGTLRVAVGGIHRMKQKPAFFNGTMIRPGEVPVIALNLMSEEQRSYIDEFTFY